MAKEGIQIVDASKFRNVYEAHCQSVADLPPRYQAAFMMHDRKSTLEAQDYAEKYGLVWEPTYH